MVPGLVFWELGRHSSKNCDASNCWAEGKLHAKSSNWRFDITLEGFEALTLGQFLNETGLTVEEAAEALGDSPLRLYRVLEGVEQMGLTAKLAAIAVKCNLPEIEPGD